MQLRLYQQRIAHEGMNILFKHKILYLAMECRTGKTITALEIVKLSGLKNILFITKIKAFSSIKDDYSHYSEHYQCTIINRESIHKIDPTIKFDIVIIDEAHGYGSYPKPSKYAKDIKKKFGHLPIIFLSGTPSPESSSQLYHQFWISKFSPWKEYNNFYKWAGDYVIISKIYTSYGQANDYSGGIKDKIMRDIAPYMLTFTQEQAGFSTVIDEHILYVDMLPSTYTLIDNLLTNKIVKGKTEVILADTAVKLQQKTHQLSSGTIKFESGKSMVIDDSKARFIKNKFGKIGIFYQYKAELECIQSVYGDDITTDLEVFNTTNKSIALQVVSAREGISLSKAEAIVFYNISFSAVSYWQARDRKTTIDGGANNVYWIFSKGGIEDKIYSAVMAKKSYTTDIFKKDYKYIC